MVSISTRTTGAHRRLIGQHYERLAQQYLQKAGLVFIARNVQIGKEELDLIMRDGQTWVFVEVRYRRQNDYGGALASINRAKCRHLRQAAQRWLLLHQGSSLENCDCRFDIVAITDQQWQWLPNAFNE